ncbi:DUF4123 domain-containing protein [Achromobacter aloeverae]|uniref:DUF4123 domain-containing protein n=1 Tax=Achromobacter aloeverae TaxID=1750518 RepID=A0A4Q1HGG7_9BURK|nr:DUF4123 domain-containing protein [Achromobacter aloeverae]RXN86219.1 DUF4123 domain-containing protein [Achromobacter aloeverae]
MNVSWEATLADLVAELPRYRGPHGEAARACVVVDFRGHPDLLALLLKAGNLTFGSVWAQTGLDVYGDVAPMIIELDGASQDVLGGARTGDVSTTLLRLLHALHERDGGRYAMIGFCSAAPLEALIAHFGHFCDYALPDGREFFVHWYDSRILVRALQVWDEAQRADFLAPLGTLAYAQRGGDYARVQGGALASVDPHGDILRLTPGQHQLFFDLDYPDKLAVQLRRLYMGMLPGDPGQDALVPRVRDQLERARGHGVAGDKDTFDYVAWGISISPRFDEHPLIKAALAAYRPDADGGLSGCLAHVPDSVWDELQSAEDANTHG